MTPHFGHLTANAEFEALCGLPATEDAVFQSRMKDVLPCLPRLLRELGYETLASHSNHQDSWGRDTAYKYMGFAQFNAYQAFVRDDLDGVFLNDASFFRQNREVLARMDRSTPTSTIWSPSVLTIPISSTTSGGRLSYRSRRPIPWCRTTPMRWPTQAGPSWIGSRRCARTILMR